MSRVQGWLVLADAIREAGAAADPADAARELREAGAPVTRNSRAQWVAPRSDPRVREWLRGLAETARHGENRGDRRPAVAGTGPDTTPGDAGSGYRAGTGQRRGG